MNAASALMLFAAIGVLLGKTIPTDIPWIGAIAIGIALLLSATYVATKLEL